MGQVEGVGDVDEDTIGRPDRRRPGGGRLGDSGSDRWGCLGALACAGGVPRLSPAGYTAWPLVEQDRPVGNIRPDPGDDHRRVAELLGLPGPHSGSAPCLAPSHPHPHLAQRSAAPEPARIESKGRAGEIPGTTTSPSVAAARNSACAAVDTALEGLTERHRTVIRLRIWDQFSFAEIGARLNLSEDAARMLYGRALAKLRESMRPGHDPG